MARIPSTYEDLLNKLNAMGGNFELSQDAKFHDRVTFMDRGTKKRMSLNLTNAPADVGRVWLVGSDRGQRQSVITPMITANREAAVDEDYSSDVAKIGYSATSSTGMLASMIYQSFNRAGKTGMPSKFFNRFMSQGDEEYGFSAAPSVPRGYQSTQNLSINQIGFRATVDNGPATPDERHEIIQDFIYQQSNALNPNYRAANIQNDTFVDRQGRAAARDSRPISMEYLYKGQYIPNEHGRLEPIYGAQVSSIQQHGQWNMNTKPKAVAKSNRLSSGSDPASPFSIQDGLAVPMRGRATTNTSRPSYAISNAIMPGETTGRSYERQNVVFDNFAVPGASIAYNNPDDVKADFWGTSSRRDVKLSSLNFAKLLSGEQSINMKNFASQSHGGGRQISVFGSVVTGDQKEDIKVRFGPGTWRSQGSSELVLPSYVNPVSGEFSSEEKSGYVETQGFHGDLQKAIPGMLLKYDRVSSPTMSFSGANESSTSMKGMQIKASEMFVGLDQELSGQRVTRFTGELKGNAFLYGYFGGLSQRQLKGLAKQWNRQQPGMGAKALNYVKSLEGKASQGRELGIDFNKMATEIGYEGNGLGMLTDWFGGTIGSAKAGSSRNRRNIQAYGAGYVSGDMKLGIVHGDQLQHMRENWRRSGQDDASFDQTFTMTPRGQDAQGRPLYSGTQKLSGSAMMVNMLAPRRVENVHGPGMTQEWMQAVAKQYPEFAASIGANIDTFRPRGATQSAAAGILKYALHQGAKRDFINDPSVGETDAPSNIEEIGDDTLSQIQSHLATAAADNRSPINQLRSVVDKFFPDTGGASADSLRYNKTLDQYIPNPRAILNSTFSEQGVESAGLARSMVGMLSKLGGIAGDYDMTRSQKIRAGLEAAAPLQKDVEQLVTGSGNFFKRLLGSRIPSAVSGRYNAALNLANDETHMTFDMATMAAKQMGFSQRGAVQKAREIMRSGASYVGMRLPDATGKVESRNLVNEDVYAKERFESPEAYESARTDPLNRGAIEMPYSQATGEVGDFDRDPIAGALGLNRVGDELQTIEDPRVRADVMTAEKIKSVEEGIFPDEGMRNMVNANVKQLSDFAEGKQVVGSALAQKQAYSPAEVLRTTWDRLMNKTLGMGVGYNPRRAVGGGMAAGGYSQKEIANVMSSMPGLYQPALDTALVGREASGVAAAAMIARPYFHLGYDKGDGSPRSRMLRMSRTGARERKNTMLTTAEGTRILTKEQSPMMDVDVDKLLGSNNPQELLNMGSFVSEGFSRGYTLNGKQVGMSAEQYAGWFAAPGDADSLTGQLKGKKEDQWSNIVGSYQQKMYGDVRASGGTHLAGVEKVLSTPAMMSILTRAGSKARNMRNFLTGKEKIEGANEVFNLLRSNVSSGFLNNYTTAIASHDVEHRARGMNLRSMYPANLRTAAENMGPGVKGDTMRMLSRVMDISFGPAAPQRAAQQAPIDPFEDNDLQGLLDTYAAAASTGQEPALTPDQMQSANQLAAQEEQPDLIEQKREAATRFAKQARGTGGGASGGGGRRGGGTPPAAPPSGPPDDPEDPSKRKLSANIQEDIRVNNQGVAKREGHGVHAVHARIMQYSKKAPSAMEYMHGILEGMGVTGRLEAGDVRDRMQQAFINDKEGLLSKIDPAMMKQMQGLEQMQKDSAHALFKVYNAPGLGLRGTTMAQEMGTAVSPGEKLGDDITAFASFKKMVGDFKVKNPYALEDAVGLSGEEGFKSLYSSLKPLMKGRGGVGRNMKQIREVLASQEGSVDILNMSKGMMAENISNMPSEVSEMGAFAKAIDKRDKGLLKQGGSVVQLSVDELEKLNTVFTKQREAAKNLREAHEQGLTTDVKRLDFEHRKATASAQKEFFGMLGTEAQGRVDKLQDKLLRFGTLSTTDDKAMKSALSDTMMYEKKKTQADMTSQSIVEEEQAGTFGSAARRMLGGFGLMYMRSIFNFATSGMGYGTDERLKYNQTQMGAAYSAFGERNVQQNQAQILENRMALAGSNFNAIAGAQQFAANVPLARDAYSAGSAFVGAWGYTQFAASQMTGTSQGAWLAKNAGKIGIAAAGLSILSDSYARGQDPQSLGQRIEMGNAGFNDLLGEAIQGPEKQMETSKSRAAMALAMEAGKRGLTFQQQMNTEVNYVTGFNRSPGGTLTYDRTTQQAGQAFSKGEMFSANMAYLLDKNQSLSQEAVAQATVFQAKNNVSLGDSRLTSIAEDYQFGGWAASQAKGTLAALGYTPGQMYERKQGAEFSLLGGLQMKYATGEYSDEQKETMAFGLQRASQIQGIDRVKGIGGFGGAPLDEKKLEKFFELLENMSESSLNVVQNQMQAIQLQQAAGLRTAPVTADEITGMASKAAGMSSEDRALSNAQASAFAAQAQNRINLGQRQMEQSYQFGNYDLGDKARAAIMSAPAGQEWAYNRALNLDPMMMSAMSKRGLNLSKMPGMTTLNGKTIGGEYAAMTDTDLQGNLTGLDWGTTSFRMGDVSAATMGTRLFGANWQNNKNLDAGAIQAGIGGFNLPAPITMPDGSKISSVGGQMGMNLYASQMQMNQQLAMASLQSRGLQSDITYQKKMWGIEDQQRALSHENTMWSFAFQGRQIDTNQRQFSEGQTLSKFTSMLQRGWTREDWGHQDNARQLQWGWKQEDFQEEVRFMTGRQRRLAERQNKRDTTMHNLEEDSVERGKDRQEELWKLEDERFNMTKQHYEESVNMQREQLAHSKQYYLENKRLEDGKISLSRKHWEEEMKLQKESIALSQKYAIEQHKLQVTMTQLAMASQLTKGAMSTLADNGMENMRRAMLSSLPVIAQFASYLSLIASMRPPTGGYGSSYYTSNSGSYTSGQPITVNIGNDQLSSYVVRTVGSALRY